MRPRQPSDGAPYRIILGYELCFESFAASAKVAAMPRRKPKRFVASKAVKSAAREVIGSPRASRVLPAKKKLPDKHKSTLGKLLQES